jgi:2,3-bisphosphoglycerate-dependent phosphoglycerate mutase
MSTIYLFRHGQTTYNRDKIFTGWSDPPLTNLGVEQAEYLATLLKDTKINIAYQSRLIRSIHTLEIVLKPHLKKPQIITDDRVIERNYGDLNDHPHQEIIDKYSQEQFEIWHRGYHTPPPNGESFADVEVRVGDFIADLKKLYSDKSLNIAISAHGNSIRLFRKIMENSTEEEATSWVIPYDQIFKYQI